MRTLKPALLGVGVMLACFVPPIVHFVSGPLSPAIAGFVVGLRTRCPLGQATAIAAWMGVILLGVAGIVVAVASTFVPGLLPGINLTVAALGALGVFLYVFWLAMLGGWAGGAFARRPDA